MYNVFRDQGENKEDKTMTNTFKADTFTATTGETLTAIYCPELGELAVETLGDIVCTEQDAFEDVIAGTPWEGAENLDFAAEWPAADLDSIRSAGLREWVAAKK